MIGDYTIDWSLEARLTLEEIRAYIYTKNGPDTANRYVRKIMAKADILAILPHAGRPSHYPPWDQRGYRSLAAPAGGFRLLYTIDEAHHRIHILRVYTTKLPFPDPT